jgi:Cu-Zn family superoxide dismutase
MVICRSLRSVVALAPTVVVLAGLAVPANAQQARAALTSADGRPVGTVIFRETPHGVLLSVEIGALPPGAHAFHIHQTGACTPPEFNSAGGHYDAGGHRHGIANPQGKHAGDLPNIHVAANGMVDLEILADAVSLADGGTRAPLFDADGSAIVVHAGTDDHVSDPAGNAGARIACGVIERVN